MNNKLAVISLCDKGAIIARKITAKLGGDLFLHEIVTDQSNAKSFKRVIELTEVIFMQYKGIIYIMPCGVVARAIAPCIKSKLTDPAVVVLDIKARHAISFLSGHEGGANELTLEVANLLGAEPVITTTTEAEKDIIAGIGCRKGANKEEILSLFQAALEKAKVTKDDVRFIATAEIKREEEGLLAACQELEIPLRIISHEEIINTPIDFTESEFVKDKTGLPAVAEPAALLAGRRTKLILTRIANQGVTVALAREL